MFGDAKDADVAGSFGGAIVFDQVTGTDRFRYTLGERMAAAVLQDDPDWLHLHGTGVFYRQRRTRW